MLLVPYIVLFAKITFRLLRRSEVCPPSSLSDVPLLFHLSRFFTSISCSMYHSTTIDLSVEPAFARPCKNFFPCHSLTRSLHAPFMVYSWCVGTELCQNTYLFVKISLFSLHQVRYRVPLACTFRLPLISLGTNSQKSARREVKQFDTRPIGRQLSCIEAQGELAETECIEVQAKLSFPRLCSG